MSQKKPTDFLKQVVGHNVIVKLNSGVTYKGLLMMMGPGSLVDVGLGMYDVQGSWPASMDS